VTSHQPVRRPVRRSFSEGGSSKSGGGSFSEGGSAKSEGGSTVTSIISRIFPLSSFVFFVYFVVNIYLEIRENIVIPSAAEGPEIRGLKNVKTNPIFSKS